MTFSDSLAKQAAETIEAQKRLGRQAAKRAAANDSDPVAAAMLAEDLYTPNCCHETIVERVCGPYRKRAA